MPALGVGVGGEAREQRLTLQCLHLFLLLLCWHLALAAQEYFAIQMSLVCVGLHGFVCLNAELKGGDNVLDGHCRKMQTTRQRNALEALLE